jgi:hypothetical protein
MARAPLLSCGKALWRRRAYGTQKPVLPRLDERGTPRGGGQAAALAV